MLHSLPTIRKLSVNCIELIYFCSFFVASHRMKKFRIFSPGTTFTDFPGTIFLRCGATEKKFEFEPDRNFDFSAELATFVYIRVRQPEQFPEKNPDLLAFSIRKTAFIWISEPLGVSCQSRLHLKVTVQY